MSSHLFNEMDKLKKLLLEVSALAEDSLHKSVISVNELNEVLARSVRDQDKKPRLARRRPRLSSLPILRA